MTSFRSQPGSKLHFWSIILWTLGFLFVSWRDTGLLSQDLRLILYFAGLLALVGAFVTSLFAYLKAARLSAAAYQEVEHS